MDAKNLVRKYIGENMVLVGASDLTDDTSFLSLGMIDSTGIFELIAFVEDTFGIKVGDSELLPENFDSLNAIQAYVERKLAEARS